MSSNRPVVVLALAAALVLVAVPGLSTLVRFLDVAQMSELAAVVVVGDVERIDVGWNRSGTKILTKVRVAVDEVLKGDPGLDEVTVRQLGGTTKDAAAWISGAPVFEEGERVLLFLEARPGDSDYLVLGLYQGRYFVIDDPQGGGELLERPIPSQGVTIMDTAELPAVSESLDLDEVRAIVRGGAR